MIDIGLTHIALPAANVDRSIEFYSKYAEMKVLHRRTDAETGVAVVWLSDCTRPFVIVLIQTSSVQPVLSPLAHLGVGCQSRESMDFLCEHGTPRRSAASRSQKILDTRSGTGLTCEIQTVIPSNYLMGKKLD